MAHVRSALTVVREIGDVDLVAECLGHLGQADLARDEPAHAARLLIAAATLREREAVPTTPPDQERIDRLLATALSALDSNAEAAARADAAALDVASAVDYALAFGGPSRSANGSIGGAGIAVEPR